MLRVYVSVLISAPNNKFPLHLAGRYELDCLRSKVKTMVHFAVGVLQ